MSPYVIKIFELLNKVTAPLKGYRTAIAAVGYLCVALYCLLNGQIELAATHFLALLAILGLRPEEPPAVEGQDILPMRP